MAVSTFCPLVSPWGFFRIEKLIFHIRAGQGCACPVKTIGCTMSGAAGQDIAGKRPGKRPGHTGIWSDSFGGSDRRRLFRWFPVRLWFQGRSGAAASCSWCLSMLAASAVGNPVPLAGKSILRSLFEKLPLMKFSGMNFGHRRKWKASRCGKFRFLQQLALQNIFSSNQLTIWILHVEQQMKRARSVP